MADHITAVCRSGYYHWVLSTTPAALCCAVADAGGSHDACPFFCQHTYYCNSVLYGVADNQLQRLQSVQNAAVDWLPVHEDLSTPRQCCNHCTGCLLGSGLSTNLCCVLTTGVALDVILSGPANDSGQGWLCSTSVGILSELPHR